MSGQNSRPPTLVVTVQEGRNLSDGGTGSVDAYCIVKLGKYSQKTRTVKSQKNPTFNQQFTIPVSSTDDTLEIEVWDWDRLSSDDKLGVIKVHLKTLEDWKDHDLWYPVTKSKGPISQQPETLGSREPNNSKSGQIRLKLRYYDDKREREEAERKKMEEYRRQLEQKSREQNNEAFALRQMQRKREALVARASNLRNKALYSSSTMALANLMKFFCIGQMLFAFLIALYRADLTCAIALFGIYGATERHFDSVLMYLILISVSIPIDLTWVIIEAQYLSLLTDAQYAEMSAAESSLNGTRMFALVASCLQLAAKFIVFFFVAYLLIELKNKKAGRRPARRAQDLNAPFANADVGLGGSGPLSPQVGRDYDNASQYGAPSHYGSQYGYAGSVGGR